MKRAYLGLFLALFVLVGTAIGQDAPVINEIFYDAVGSDAGTFTEIKGPGGLSLDGYALAGVNGNGGAVYRVIDLTGNSIPADGYFVMAQDGTVAEADFIDAGADWQNGPDQVQLWFIAGADTITIDSICYGGSADLNCEGGTNGPDVGDGNSISRCPDGQDTDDNEVDTAETPPTAGVENECIVIEPLELTVCQVMELDETGFPVNFGEIVHIVDPVTTLNDNLIYHGSRFEVAVTDGECCTYLFDTGLNDVVMDEGTVLDVTGRVSFFNGKTEIDQLEITVLGMGPVPDPAEITVGEFVADGESFESCLIKICGLTIVDGTWPDEGSSGFITVDDGTGQVLMYIDVDTNIDGSPAPVEPFTVIGLGGQFDNESPYFEEYQLTPRYLSDILSGEDCPPPFATKQSTWGRIKSTYKDK